MKVNPIKYFYHNVLPVRLKSYVENVREPRRQLKNIYSPEYCATNSIFIHIPKTAGTSVSQALYGMQPWHHLARSYQQIDPVKFDQYFSFAFVRNPWDRLLSIYNYACKITNPPYRGPLSDIASHKTFESFVLEWFEQNNVHEHYFLRSQFSFVSVDEERVALNYVGRFEQLDADFAHVCKALGINVELPKLNQAIQKKDFRHAYTSEMVDKVAVVYQDDVKKLEYKFE